MPKNPEASDTSNPLRSDPLMATVFTFDKNGKRRVHKQQETEPASPLLPHLKIVLRQLNARKFDDELSSDEKNSTFATVGNVQEAADGDRENDKIILRFVTGVFNSNTNKVPAPPYLRSWELFGLWKHDCDNWFWINDPILGSAKLEIEVMTEPRLLQRSHMLYLTKYGSAFYMLPSAMRMKSPSEEDLLGSKPEFGWPTSKLRVQTDVGQL